MTQEQIDQIRADFEQSFRQSCKDMMPDAIDDLLMRNSSGDYITEGTYSAFHYWLLAHARYAETGKQTRTQLPEGIDRVRNAATGEYVGYAGGEEAVRDEFGVHMLDLPYKTRSRPAPAPAVPDKLDEYTNPDAWNSGYAAGWNDCRKATLTATKEQQK